MEVDPEAYRTVGVPGLALSEIAHSWAVQSAPGILATWSLAAARLLVAWGKNPSEVDPAAHRTVDEPGFALQRWGTPGQIKLPCKTT